MPGPWIWIYPGLQLPLKAEQMIDSEQGGDSQMEGSPN